MPANLNNCMVCFSSYAPYKTGKDEDLGAYWCVVPQGIYIRKWYTFWRLTFIPNAPKGVCQFHNPKSAFYQPPAIV